MCCTGHAMMSSSCPGETYFYTGCVDQSWKHIFSTTPKNCRNEKCKSLTKHLLEILWLWLGVFGCTKTHVSSWESHVNSGAWRLSAATWVQSNSITPWSWFEGDRCALILRTLKALQKKKTFVCCSPEGSRVSYSGRKGRKPWHSIAWNLWLSQLDSSKWTCCFGDFIGFHGFHGFHDFRIQSLQWILSDSILIQDLVCRLEQAQPHQEVISSEKSIENIQKELRRVSVLTCNWLLPIEICLWFLYARQTYHTYPVGDLRSNLLGLFKSFRFVYWSRTL